MSQLNKLYLSQMSRQQGHPLISAQTFLLPHQKYEIFEVMNIEPSDGRTVLRVLERYGRVLYVFYEQNTFMALDTLYKNGGWIRKYMLYDGRGCFSHPQTGNYME